MNKSYRKMARRGIKKSLTRFLSILGIVALGTGFLSGLLATMPDMKDSADAFYDSQNTFDVQIQGTMGVTKSDINYLNTLDYVEDAQGLYTFDLLMKRSDEESFVTRLAARDFKDDKVINGTELLSGRYPKSANECVVSIVNPYTFQMKVGETLIVDPKNKDIKDVKKKLKYEEFKVVGIVRSPLTISIHGDVSNVGDGKVSLGMYVMNEAYLEKDVYTAGVLTVTGKEGISSFDDAYKDRIAQVEKDLKAVGTDRSKIRTDFIVGEAQKKLDDAKKEYEEGKAEADAELASAEAKIRDAENDINNGRQEIADARATLDQNEANLLAQEKTLQDAAPQIEELKQMVAAGIPLPPEAVAQIQQYDAGVAAIADGKAQIANGRATLDEKEGELADGERTLADSRATYESEKAKAEAELADAAKKIADGEEDIKDIKAAKWVLTDRSDNMGMHNFELDVEKIGAIAIVFPFFFFLIAALVALTTMTRMIEEERGQIGTLKSLGYSNREILSYYLMYGFMASFLGVLIGLSVGFVLFPKVISNAYSMMYSFPEIETKVIWTIAIPVSLIIILGILLVSYLACRSELKEKPANLLIPKAPKNGKRILLERITPVWKRLKFTRKVTLRNLFRYKKRFLMTIIGIGGCFALLLAGFGVRDSVSDIVNLQYGEINRYDYIMEVAEEKDAAGGEIKAVLDDKKMADVYGYFNGDPVTVSNKKATVKANFILPKDEKSLPTFFSLRERKSGADIAFQEDSLVLTEKMAESLDVSVGDEVNLKLNSGREGSAVVTGIAENYVDSSVYITPQIYEQVFSRTPEFNKVYIKSENEKLAEELLSKDNVTYVISAETIMENFRDSVKSIDYVIMVLILTAGALAIIVLYNLTNVNIRERTKELATIKVLGFYEKEVADYIFRETNILSGLGILFGIPVGIVLHQFIMKTIEVEQIMFGRHIYWQSYLYSAGLTIVFTILVNLIMRRSIKSIDMVESMKAND